MTLTSKNVISNMGNTGFGLDSVIFLEFETGPDAGQSAITNRIMLRTESVTITTNKRANSVPIPFSGIVTGQSRAVMIDLGTSTKDVQIGRCILHDQIISRKYEDGEVINRVMTGFEIAQLLHSAIDSSFVQGSQHISKLYVLYPSRVGKDYNYHSGVDENTPHEDLPLLPFTWDSRTLDEAGSVPLTHFPEVGTALTDLKPIYGFIDRFSTTFTSGNMVEIGGFTFQEAFNIGIN